MSVPFVAVPFSSSSSSSSSIIIINYMPVPLFRPSSLACLYLFYGSVDGVARLVEAAGGLLALGDDLLVKVPPLQRTHPPRVPHALEVLDPRRIVQQHSAARLADALRERKGGGARWHGNVEVKQIIPPSKFEQFVSGSHSLPSSPCKYVCQVNHVLSNFGGKSCRATRRAAAAAAGCIHVLQIP